MKKIAKITLGITAVSVLTIGLIGITNINAGNKVKLHHGSQTIEVSINAVSGHLRHGDKVHEVVNCLYCIDIKN